MRERLKGRRKPAAAVPMVGTTKKMAFIHTSCVCDSPMNGNEPGIRNVEIEVISIITRLSPIRRTFFEVLDGTSTSLILDSPGRSL